MRRVTLLLIKYYQKYFSRALSGTFYLADRSCRFTPTCSEYISQAIARYGIIKGAWRGLGRLLRCHPFSRGGVDLLK